MNAELFAKLRECCRDDAAFEQLQQLLQSSLESPLDQFPTEKESHFERESTMIRVIGALGQAIIDRVNQSQNFEASLQSTLHEIRQFLAADRVAVYRFNPDWSGQFICESVQSGWASLVEQQFQIPHLLENISECSLKNFETYQGKTDTLIQTTQGEILQNHRSFVSSDIYKQGFSRCYLDILQQYQARAYAIVPIYLQEKLWGMLAAYQNNAPRVWTKLEIDLLGQVSQQLGAALQLENSIQIAHLQAERRQLIANIADRIRQPLDIQVILATTTQETRQLLKADRVAVYQFNPDWSGEFVAESVSGRWVRLVGDGIEKVWEDTHLQETQGGRYRRNETLAVDDIYTVGHMDCHIQLLEQFQAKAYAIAPIFSGKKLWGLLAAYQNSGARTWKPEEIDLLAQIGVHLGIALQQAELIANLRQEVVERQQAEHLIRHLNQDLKRRNTELEAINKELEAFAYSVSHDLRAPLRSIDGFSQALLEDYSEAIDATGQDYLRRVRTATQRMGQLIDDLLTLSRVTRSELRYETVDLSAIAQEIANELLHAEPNRQVKFQIQPELRVNGDSRLLRVMLVNLLENAWKFTSKHPFAHIEFSATFHEGKKIYFVRDDGAGFDMSYAQKLFGAFQRLHSMQEFSGNGVGLATIQRIVHRHGGRVWAEAKVEEGATFYFELP